MNNITPALIILAVGVFIVGVALFALLRSCRQRTKIEGAGDDSSVFIASLGSTHGGSSGHHHGGESASSSHHGGFDGGGGHGGH
jgi:uncharacterized membrane protein YgcG